MLSQLIQINRTFLRFSFLRVFFLQCPHNGSDAPFHLSGTDKGSVQRDKQFLIKAGEEVWGQVRGKRSELLVPQRTVYKVNAIL